MCVLVVAQLKVWLSFWQQSVVLLHVSPAPRQLLQTLGADPRPKQTGASPPVVDGQQSPALLHPCPSGWHTQSRSWNSFSTWFGLKGVVPVLVAGTVNCCNFTNGVGICTTPNQPVAAGLPEIHPTLSLNPIRFVCGEITKSRFYIRCDEPATTRNPISTGLGGNLRTQNSFIQRLRCRFTCALSVRMRLRSRSTGSRRHLQRHESQNARVETRR